MGHLQVEAFRLHTPMVTNKSQSPQVPGYGVNWVSLRPKPENSQKRNSLRWQQSSTFPRWYHPDPAEPHIHKTSYWREAIATLAKGWCYLKLVTRKQKLKLFQLDVCSTLFWEGSAQDVLSGGYLLAKVVQTVAFQHFSCSDGGAKLAWEVVKSGWVVVGPTTMHRPVWAEHW